MRYKIEKKRRIAPLPREINSGVLDTSLGDQSVLQSANVSNGSPPDSADLSRPSDANSSESSLQSGNSDNSGGSSFTLSRNRRSTDVKFTDAVIGLQALSRISSGVALEIGLMDGSIIPEDAVIKLLRLGTLTLQDIIGLDQAAIDTALALLPLPPPGNDALKKMEDWLVALNGIRLSSKFMETFKEFPGQAEYVAHLVEVEKIKDLATTVADWQLKVSNVFPAFKKVNVTSAVENEKAADDVFLFADPLKKGLGSIETMATDMKASLVALIEAKKLEKFANFYEILNKEYQIREKLGERLSFNAYKETLIDSFKKAYELRDSLKNQDALRVLHEVIQSRDTSIHKSFDFLSGFPSGFNELGQLYGDSSNQWVTSRVSNSSIFTDNLQKVLSPFKQLKDALEHTVDSWKSLDDVSLRQVIGAWSGLTDLPIDMQTTSSNIDSVHGCEESRAPPSRKLDSISTELSNVQNLNQRIMALPVFDYIEKLENLKLLKDLLPKDPIPADKLTAAKEYLNAMKKSKKFIEVFPILEKLQTDIASLTKAITEIPTLVGTVKNEMIHITEYHKVVAEDNNVNFFICLKDNVGDKTVSIKKLIEAIQNGRLQQATIDSAKIVIDKIIADKGSLPEAVKKAESLKRDSPEVTYLQSTFDKTYKEVAKTLGMGVQGLAAIEKVSKDRKHLDPLLSMVDEILKDVKGKGLSQNYQNTLGKLKNLQEFFTKIDDFLKSVDTRKKRQTGFTDAEKYFNKAAGIPTVVIDMKIFQEAIDELKKVIPTKYDAIDPALKALEQMDLDFARFEIQNSAPSLSDINKFFSEYITELSKPVAVPPGGPQGSPSASASISPLMMTSPGLEITTLGGFDAFIATTLGMIVVYGGSTVVIVVIVTGTVWYCFRRKSKPTPIPIPIPIPIPPSPPDSGKKDDPKPVPDKPIEVKVDTKIAEVVKVDAPNDTPKDTPKEVPEVPSLRVDPTQEFLDNEEALLLSKTSVEVIHSKGRQDAMSPAYWAGKVLMAMTTIGNTNIAVDNQIDNLKERRNCLFYCIPSTMAKITGFKDNFINVNVCDFQPYKYFMGQAPMDGTGCVKKGEPERLDTREKQWALFDQNDIGIVAQLCNFVENEKVKCAEYYSRKQGGEVIYGMYTIRTKEIKTGMKEFTDNELYTLYKLEYTNSKTGDVKTIDVLLFTGWPDKTVPLKAEPALEIIKFLDSYKKNVFVHCSLGVGRTGTLVAIKYGIDLCQRQKVNQVTQIISPIRAIRYGAVQSPDQVIYVILCVTKGIMDDRGIKYYKYYNALDYFNRNVVNEVYAWLNRDSDTYRKKPWKLKFELEKDFTAMKTECKQKRDAFKATLSVMQLKNLEKSEEEWLEKTGENSIDSNDSKKTLGEKKTSSEDGSKIQKTLENPSKVASVGQEKKASKEKPKKSKEAK